MGWAGPSEEMTVRWDLDDQKEAAVQSPGKSRVSRQKERLSSGKPRLHLLAVTLVPLTGAALPSGLQLEGCKCNPMVDIPRG